MSNTVTSAYIDLATFDEIEKYLYNGPAAITYFVRCVRKATWFSQVPVPLSKANGVPDFGAQGVGFKISRAGDYLLHVWLRFCLPTVSVASGGTARWIHNVGHNAICLTWITFNDLKVQEFDSHWLDMWAAHTVPASKKTGYHNMIGETPVLTTAAGPSTGLPSYIVNVPLPYFFTRDSGIALPTAALPYNEMIINFDFRSVSQLLVTTGAGVNSLDLHMSKVELWANYAVVSNEERVKMGKCPRDMVIEQVQKHGNRTFDPTKGTNSFDIRMSHAAKALFWNVMNATPVGGISTSTPKELSNYGAENDFASTIDPIIESSLLYENTYRLYEMGSDYFSLVQQFYFWTTIPEQVGFHSYSYALKPELMDPTGSTNYGKLTNVSLELRPGALAASLGVSTCKYEAVIRLLNFNIVRVSGGALGLPVL